jgi:nitroreductase
MDDDLQQLEAELKRLRPAAPTRDFLARVARELDEPVPVKRPARRAAPLWWLWAGALPAAAALAVMVTLATRHRTSPAATPQPIVIAAPSPSKPTPAEELIAESAAAFKPVAAENVLLAAQDEGLVTLEDGTPARRQRFNYVDTITWKNPRTNASIRWTVPREEVRVVPVKFQ